MCISQLDLSLSRTFYKWMLGGQESNLGPHDIRDVSPSFYQSYIKLDQINKEKKRIDADQTHVSYLLLYINLRGYLFPPFPHIYNALVNCSSGFFLLPYTICTPASISSQSSLISPLIQRFALGAIVCLSPGG